MLDQSRTERHRHSVSSVALRRQLPSLGRADFFEDPLSRRLRFGHLALNNTNDDHEDRPAHATAALRWR